MKYSDPLEKPSYPDRVNYANGLLLDENDFKAEQAYNRGRLSRALAYLHGPGTVAGLEVIAVNDNNEHVIYVSPGLAIDRIGRLIELPAPYCIRAQQWFDTKAIDELEESYARSEEGDPPQRAVVADVYIGFNNCERGMTPSFGVGNVDATDAFTAARLRDSVSFNLILRTELDKDTATQKPPHQPLIEDNPNLPLSFDEAVEAIRTFKLDHAWKQSDFWNDVDNSINRGPEYTPEQDGTEILLARVRLPAAGSPVAYDTNGAIQVDNGIRVLSYTSYELFWLIHATGGN